MLGIIKMHTSLSRLASLVREKADILDQYAKLLTNEQNNSIGIQVHGKLDKLASELRRVEAEIAEFDDIHILTEQYKEVMVQTITKKRMARNKMPLRFLVWKIVSEQPVSMPELLEKVRNSNYQTKCVSKDKFQDCVQQAVMACQKTGLVYRDKAQKLYKAVKPNMDDESVLQILNCRRKLILQENSPLQNSQNGVE